MTREVAAARADVDVYYADVRDIDADVHDALLAEEDFTQLAAMSASTCNR